MATNDILVLPSQRTQYTLIEEHTLNYRGLKGIYKGLYKGSIRELRNIP